MDLSFGFYYTSVILVQKKKTRGKRNSAGKMPLSKQEEKLQLLLAQHPLKVEVTVILPDGGHSAVLTFGYLYHLKIVNVEVKVELGSGAKALSGDKEVRLYLKMLL